ncbi:MAG TPA: glycosyltransferase family 9 protein [Anaeromyxobacteraceae bacterium]|nr:glycosyltransferase family 9 protein [Anaeromyxobacteraceae bacterium]
MRSILVIRYSALGDVVLATSVIDPLRERFPEARIEWVTSPAYAPLLEGLPGIERVHRLGSGGIREAMRLATALRGRFDLAVDLQNKVRSAVVARAAGRTVLSLRRRTARQALLSLVGLDPPVRGPHATRIYADLLRPLGIRAPGPTRVALPPAARDAAAVPLAGVPRPRVAFAPGASNATKRWPAGRFAEVADALAAGGASVVLAGGPADAEAIATFRSALRSPISADLSNLSVEGLAAGLAAVDLLVACDSGPVHLAGAVGTPAVAVFGPTSPERWGPRPPGRAVRLPVDCSPCTNHGGDRCPEGHHRCMEELPAEAVVEAARAVLGSPGGADPPAGPA